MARTGSSRRDALARKLSSCKDLVKASLVVNRRRCGKAKCRCADGKPHESLAFTFKQGGRSVLLHVPKHLEAQARKANGDYKKLKDLVEQLSELNLASWRKKVKR